MSDPHPRYIVKEIRGYSGGGPGSSNVETADFMVLDCWNCYRVVYYDKTKMTQKGDARPLSLHDRGKEADRICLRMNVEHDDWLYAKDAA